jgi:RNase P/RNase MRP subunit POP5
MKQTAVEWLVMTYNQRQGYIRFEDIEQAKKIEEEQTKKAIMFALDEDGHTGDWKIRFANEYVNNLKHQK